MLINAFFIMTILILEITNEIKNETKTKGKCIFLLSNSTAFNFHYLIYLIMDIK